MPALPRGFIGTYIQGVIYPARCAKQMRKLAGAVIVLSWLGAYMMRRAPRRAMSGVRDHDRERKAKVPASVAAKSGQSSLPLANAVTAHHHSRTPSPRTGPVRPDADSPA